MAQPIYTTWSSSKKSRFKRDVRNGEKLDLISKRYKIGKNTIRRAIKFFKITNPNTKYRISKEEEEFIAGLFPNNNYHYILDQFFEVYGKKISRRTINSVAQRRNLEKTEEYKHQMFKEISQLGAKKRMETETTEQFRESMRKMVNEAIEKDRWRLAHGLEQKTKRNLNLNYQLARKRWYTKGNLIARHNYFHIDSRTLGYDEQTIRNKRLEERYKKIFDFVPADGFDEENSVFTTNNKKKNGKSKAS